MRHFHDAFPRLSSYTLSRRVWGDEVGMFRLQLFELLDQLVEIEIADFWSVEDKIPVFVMADLLPQSLDPGCDVFTRAGHGQEIIFVKCGRLLWRGLLAPLCSGLQWQGIL